MTNDSNDISRVHNFWSGFSLGALFCAGCLYFFGTKNGRETMKKLIDITDDLEDSAYDLFNELRKEAVEKREIIVDSPSLVTEASENLENVMDKIKSVFPAKKEIKKYFVKNGKFIK